MASGALETVVSRKLSVLLTPLSIRFCLLAILDPGIRRDDGGFDLKLSAIRLSIVSVSSGWMIRYNASA